MFPVLYLIEEGIVEYIDARYNKSEEYLTKMKELQRTSKKNLAARLEIIEFIETNIPTKTKLWVDY